MDTEKLLGEALSLLGDAFLALEYDKVAPVLQNRITQFLDRVGTDEQVRLMRLAIHSN